MQPHGGPQPEPARPLSFVNPPSPCRAVIHMVDGSLSPRTPVVDQFEAGAPLSSLNLTGGRS